MSGEGSRYQTLREISGGVAFKSGDHALKAALSAHIEY